MQGLRAGVLAGVVAAMVVGQAPVAAQPPGHVFSGGAMARFCTEAQKVIGQTELESTNVLQPTVEAFISSDAAPWDDADGVDLPLTTQQYTSTFPHPAEGRTLATVVSCKMKSAEGLIAHYGPDAATPGSLCSDVHARVLDEVYDALTPAEERRLVHQRHEVVLDPDLVSWGGPDWTSPFPPEIAYVDPAGTLHLRGKAMLVPTVFPVPMVGPPKRGVHYCHLAAPDLVRELVVGDVTSQPDASILPG